MTHPRSKWGHDAFHKQGQRLVYDANLVFSDFKTNIAGLWTLPCGGLPPNAAW